MTKRKRPQQLSRFLANILGKCPYEFGLIPDTDGFVKIKELLKAVTEEPGWRHVRRGDIDELFLIESSVPLEIQGNHIRATNRSYSSVAEQDTDPPKILYAWVRSKAHSVTLEKGIRPTSLSKVVLSSDRQMAEKIAKRIDNKPVILTVQVAQSIKQGVSFSKTGDSLYLSDHIPAGCFSAPSLPKTKIAAKQEKEAEVPEKKYPGSFVMDHFSDNVKKDKPSRKDLHGKKKNIYWKKERKHRQKFKWKDF
jgi:putative RNA 2'-phosphotransferase